MQPEVEVSVIVACRNEVKDIRELLDCIVAQDWQDLSWELLIADGVSNDGTLEILRTFASLHTNVQVLVNPGHIVSTGLNLAIRAARGRCILRMDAHTVYAPDYVRKCLSVLERTGADNVGGPARTRPRSISERLFSAAYHSPFSCGGARFHNPDYEGPVDTVPYGCWRRDIFDRIGYFDESLVRNQDDEFNLRIQRNGGAIWQSAEIVSWYTPRNSILRLWKQYFQYGFWKVAVIRKHRMPASLRHLVPALFVVLFVGSVFGTAIAFAVGSRLGETWLCLVSGLLLFAYASACIIASVAARRSVKTSAIVLLPFLFPIYHFAYGSGFVTALLLGKTLRTAGTTTGISR